MDAIDVAVVAIDHSGCITTIHNYQQYPFPADLRRRARAINADTSLGEVSAIDVELAKAYADAVNQMLQASELSASDIHAIGCHGQTVLHLPAAIPPRSVQLGDASVLAWQTQIAVVNDFRSMDIAAGGQGAPLAAAFHRHHFAKNAPCVVLNIGGIANISVLPAQGKDCCAFDTGPGNGLLDDWYAIHCQGRYDNEGAWAASGTVDKELLAALLSDYTFSTKPPKSSGRDDFNLNWLHGVIADLGRADAPSPADVQATLLELSVQTICKAITEYAAGTKVVYVCGGGIHNTALMVRLRQLLSPLVVDSTAVLGIAPDAVEAVCFAWLARLRMQQIPLSQQTLTGAKKEYIAGRVCVVPQHREDNGQPADIVT